ncbi:hypothetical protein [Methylobacterium sp. SD21]|uniref:hypothetical protein n=1 Tax=Methylobacterium litchii TaxID=3138810 RepID=UPI00313E816D
MRLLAVLATALRAIALAPILVFRAGRWVLRAVAGRQPDPVLPATSAAAEYLEASTAPGPRLATVDGVPVRSETGVTLVLAARHAVAGGPAVDVGGLSDEIQVWLASLGEDELHLLARTPPHVAESIARGEPVPGLPPLHADTSASQADISAPSADMSEDAGVAYSWPEGDEPADDAMRSLMAHLQAQHLRLRRTA